MILEETDGNPYDLEIQATDLAGNVTTKINSNYIIDTAAPADPVAAPDLQSGSDLGSSTTDNITSDDSPSFDVMCTEVGSTITLYVDGNSDNTHTCTAVGTETATLFTTAEGAHDITYTETDVVGNESGQSPALSVTIDTSATVPNLSSISIDTGSSSTDQITNDQTLTFSGTAGVNDSVEVFIDGISVGTTNADASGNWTFDHTGTSLAAGNYNITAVSTDAAGNISIPSAALALTLDITAPATPASAPDLQSGSDTGVNTDNITSITTPAFDVTCTEVGSTITLYVYGVANGTHTCTAVGTETATIAPALVDGTYALTTTETDAAGNESGVSPALSVTLDTTLSPATTINTATNGSPVTGTAEAGASVVITTPSGASCTTTADASGNYTCMLAPSPLDGEDLTAVTTDIAGNTDAPGTTMAGGIDLSAPTSPTIDTVAAGSSTITGTGEDGTTITLTGITCTNAPVIVAAGVWSCDVTPGQEPIAGDTITAISTDSAGNTSTGSYTIPNPSSSGGGSSHYSQSELDNIFGNNNSNTEESDTTETNDTLGEGKSCPSNTWIYENMKAGDRNGNYSSWEGGTITEVKLLQAHMNRLGFASGPEDGILGPITDGAIKRMQAHLGTFQDGMVGPITRSLINNSCSGEEPVVEETPVIEDAQCFINYTRLIKQGMIGNDVRQVQTCMDSLGHPTGPFDGIYGGLTYKGIISYQTANNLHIDGLIGPETAEHLNSLSGVQLDGVTPLN